MRKFLPLLMNSAILLCAVQWIHAQDQLFISEIADPGDEYTARFVELYNAGSEPVDFESIPFYLARQVNGGNWSDVQLTGSIGAGGTYVIGGSAFESWYGFAPDLVSGVVSGNGDDAYALFEGGDAENGLIFDIYGRENEDGTGTPWEYENARAVRADDVNDARILWDHDEWVITPADYGECNPGTHLGSVPQDPKPPKGSLGIVSDTVEWGQVVNVQVAVGELTASDDIISFQFDLHYDAGTLEYSGHSLNGLITQGGTTAVNANTPGQLSFSFMDTDPIIGSGPVVTFQFNALVIGSSILDLRNAFLNNAPAETVIDGSVLIAEVSPPTGTLTFEQKDYRVGDLLSIQATFDEAMDAADPVILQFSGGFSAMEAMNRLSPTSYDLSFTIPGGSGFVSLQFAGGSDLWGNQVIATPLGAGTLNLLAFLPGDVNDDGAVQAYDAALTLQHSVGLDPLPTEDPLPWESWRFQTANVDGDGQLSAYDAGLILQYSAGVITTFGGSNRKGLEEAGVLITLDNDRMKFYPRGAVIGFNLEVPGGSRYLGEPVSTHPSYHAAFNPVAERYRFGICSSTTFPEEEPFMEIPLLEDGMVEMNMLVNAKRHSLMMDVATGLFPEAAGSISIYPNPATDYLRISGHRRVVLFELLDLTGRVQFSKYLKQGDELVSLDSAHPGIYICRISGGGKQLLRQIVVR